MDIINFSDARARLRPERRTLVPDRPPADLAGREAETIMDARPIDWNAIQEALHLLSRPKNVERLRAAVAELDAG